VVQVAPASYYAAKCRPLSARALRDEELVLNGLRVSEAIDANIEDLGVERGHHTLTILRKGGRIVTVPLAPRRARSIDLAVGERCYRPIFVAADGGRIARHAAGRICAPYRPPGRDRQARGTPYPPSRVHHRRPRCR
jgi:integrase